MKFENNTRIIWAIAAKDINDAIKNKIVQGVLIGVALMMLSSQAISLLVRLKKETTTFFWDQGKSIVIKEIVRSREQNLYPRDDLADLQMTVSQSGEPVLGLVIPVDFDKRVESSEIIELQTYYSHRYQSTKISELVTDFEAHLGSLTGATIRLDTDGHQLYPPAEGVGFPMMITIGTVLGVMTVGLILTPFLIVDEKETHTLDALLISPACTSHLLIGKSLAGLFYSLTASLLVLVFSWSWIVHWDLIILAVFLGGLSAVSIGLLVGSIFETPTNINLFIVILFIVLLMPMYFWTSLAPKLSPYLQSLMAALPSMAMYKIVRQSFTYTANSTVVLGNIVILISWTLGMLFLVAWRIRCMDR